MKRTNAEWLIAQIRDGNEAVKECLVWALSGDPELPWCLTLDDETVWFRSGEGELQCEKLVNLSPLQLHQFHALSTAFYALRDTEDQFGDAEQLIVDKIMALLGPLCPNQDYGLVRVNDSIVVKVNFDTLAYPTLRDMLVYVFEEDVADIVGERS